MRRALLSLFLLTAPLITPACDSVAPGDEDISADTEAEVRDDMSDGSARPLGTYRGMEGDLSLLVLKSDEQYHRESSPPTDGRYAFTKARGTRYIGFYVGSTLLDRYAYEIDGDQLKLRKVNTRNWFALTSSTPAWCAATVDCDLQGLTGCDDGWSCSAHHCACESDPPPPPPPTTSTPLAASIDFGGPASLLASGDVDGDGYLDLAALVVKSGKLYLMVAWGDASGQFTARLERSLGTTLEEEFRDSADLVAIGDWNGDGQLDVVTALGGLIGNGTRTPTWKALSGASTDGYKPVALASLGSDRVLLRGMTSGTVERCAYSASCTALPGPSLSGEISDLAVGDFDHDGKTDVLAGTRGFSSISTYSYLWRSRDAWSAPFQVDGLDSADYEVGDIDGDGYPDVAAQQNSIISDFPSHTQVWLSTVDGFTKLQTLYNWQNHNDNAALSDIDGDGCSDYMQIGVDGPDVALRRGQKDSSGKCTYLGPHTGDADHVDVEGWEVISTASVPADGFISVQHLDVNGDGKKELVLRTHYIPVSKPNTKVFFLAPQLP